MRPSALRTRLAERCLRAVRARRRSFVDGVLTMLFVLGREVPTALRSRRGYARAREKGEGLSASIRAVVFHARHMVWWGMSGAEARHYGGDLSRVQAVIDHVPMQSDLRWMARSRRAENLTLASKSAFARACEAHGLPHPPTLSVDLGSPATRLTPDPFPGDAIVAKPDRGSGGRGILVLRRVRAGEWAVAGAADTGRTTEGTALHQLLRQRYGAGRVVLQPLLVGHPALSRLSGNTLVTFRVVTATRGAREVEVLSALAEIPLEHGCPVPPRIVVRPVDLKTGALAGIEEAYAPAIDPGWHSLPLEDLVVPVWADVGPLTTAAHRAMAPELATVGWDLAITPDGTVLLEGNTEWRVAPHILNSAGLDLALGSRLFAAVEGTGERPIPPISMRRTNR